MKTIALSLCYFSFFVQLVMEYLKYLLIYISFNIYIFLLIYISNILNLFIIVKRFRTYGVSAIKIVIVILQRNTLFFLANFPILVR